jgi:4-hydroxyphenylacetate decarboxylase small subunit
MKDKQNLYRDSRNYVAVDVAKGIDLRTKEIVSADQIDPNFEPMPKCKRCKHFVPHAEKIEIGVCEASMNNPKFVAYPEMVAVTCAMFEEKK